MVRRRIKPGIWMVSQKDHDIVGYSDAIIEENEQTLFIKNGVLTHTVQNKDLCGYHRVTWKRVFMKVCDEEDHAQELLNGILYMRSLSYYRKLEEKESGSRADRYDGIQAIYDDKVTMSLWNNKDPDNKITLSAGPRSFREPITLEFVDLADANVFCVHQTYVRLDDQKIYIPNGFLADHGTHLVLIRDIREFFKRVDAAVLTGDLEGSHGPVTYYDPGNITAIGIGPESIFCKRKKYKYQYEYRVAVCTNEDPFRLNIGSISDIAEVFIVDRKTIVKN